MAKHTGPLGTLGDVQVEAVSYQGYHFIRVQIYSGTDPNKVEGQILLKPEGARALRDDLTKALALSTAAQLESAITQTLQSHERSGD